MDQIKEVYGLSLAYFMFHFYICLNFFSPIDRWMMNSNTFFYLLIVLMMTGVQLLID